VAAEGFFWLPAEAQASADGIAQLNLECEMTIHGEGLLKGSLYFLETPLMGRSIPLSAVALNGQRLSFTAARKGGPGYRFTGRFLKLPSSAKNGEEILVGSLEILPNGLRHRDDLASRKVVRKIEVRFHYLENPG
jgi:hypothetical protein